MKQILDRAGNILRVNNEIPVFKIDNKNYTYPDYKMVDTGRFLYPGETVKVREETLTFTNQPDDEYRDDEIKFKSYFVVADIDSGLEHIVRKSDIPNMELVERKVCKNVIAYNERLGTFFGKDLGYQSIDDLLKKIVLQYVIKRENIGSFSDDDKDIYRKAKNIVNNISIYNIDGDTGEILGKKCHIKDYKEKLRYLLFKRFFSYEIFHRINKLRIFSKDHRKLFNQHSDYINNLIDNIGYENIDTFHIGAFYDPSTNLYDVLKGLGLKNHQFHKYSLYFILHLNEKKDEIITYLNLKFGDDKIVIDEFETRSIKCYIDKILSHEHEVKQLKLFLDDEQKPDDKTWMVAKNFKEAQHIVKNFGIPDIISFDHDFDGERSGYKFARWIIEQEIYYGYRFPENFQYIIHSNNDDESMLIDNIMSSYFKFRQNWFVV